MTNESLGTEARHRIRGPLNWEQLGHRGPPMVFVHPNPTDHWVWVYQMAHFSSWFRTIGIDLPGYGRSPTAEPGLTMTDVARACWEAVDEVSSEPAVLVGCSVGAHVALHMAHEQPARTTAVILSGTSYREEKTYCLERIAEYAEEGLELRGEADLDPHDVEVTGSVASLVDCQVDGTYAVERSTGEIVIPATARPQEVLVDLVRVDGRWKVSRVEYAAEGSCVR